MKKISDREKILLHLSHHEEYESEDTAPYGVCKRGISENIGLEYEQVGKYLEELIELDMVKREVRSVVGLQREREVYFPTLEGYRKAEEELHESLGKKEVTVKTEEGEEKVRLENIDVYIDEQHPMLYTLKNMDEDGVVDLTVERRKDVFVGREKEMDKLKEKLSEVKENDCSALFVKGDAGVGKTRLISEFKEYAISKGFDFLSGGAHYDTAEPYLPLREAFKEHIEKEEETEGFTSMAMLGAQVADKKPEVVDKKMFDAERTADWNKITKRVRKIASRKPLLVFLDDMQWSDQATLQLLYYMMKDLSDSPILFVGAYRPEDVTADHGLVEFKRRIRREGLFKELKLEQLDTEHTREMIVGEIGREDIPEEFVELVHDTAEGNPLFTREIVKQMIEDKKVDVKRGKYPKSVKGVQMLDVIDDVVKRRTSRISDKTEVVLHKSAVIGEKVPFDLLRNVADMDELDLLDHLDMLGEIGLIHEDLTSENFIFSHGLIHRAVFDDISKRRRKKIHQLVAERMRDLYQRREKLADHYTDLAYHNEEGEEYEKAVENYYKAGLEAEVVYAHENAIRMCEKAVSLFERCRDDTTVNKETVLEELGDTHRIIGEYDQAIKRYKKAMVIVDEKKKKARLHRKLATVYEEKGDFKGFLKECERGLDLLDDEDAEISKLLEKKGWAFFRMGEYDQAEKTWRESVDAAEKAGSKKEISQSLHNLGTLCMKRGDYDKALVLLNQGKEIREDIGEEKLLANSLNNIGIVYYHKGEFDKCLEHNKESLEIRKKIGDKRGIGTTLNNIGVVYRIKGDLEKALDYNEECLDIMKKIGDKHGIAMSLNNIAMVHNEKGEHDRAIEHYRESIEIKKEIGDKQGIATSIDNLAIVYMEKGELDKALEHHLESLEKSRDIGDKGCTALILNNIGLTYQEKGELDKALDHSKESLKMHKEIGDKKGIGESLKTLAKVYRQKEQFQKSKEYLEKSLDLSFETDNQLLSVEILIEKAKNLIEKGETDAALQNAERAVDESIEDSMDIKEAKGRVVLGMVYREKGQLKRAKKELEKAEKIFEESGQALELPKVKYEYGLLLEKNGEKKRSKEYLEDALGSFQERGMKLWAEKCEEALEEI